MKELLKRSEAVQLSNKLAPINCVASLAFAEMKTLYLRYLSKKEVAKQNFENIDHLVVE